MKRLLPFIIPAVFGVGLTILVTRCNNPPRKAVASDASQPAPVPAPTEVVVETTPEPTPIPALMRVSLVSQNNANLGRWMVVCPDGCGSVGEFIHEGNDGFWFNDVNNKFVWIRLGGGTLIVEEQ